MGAYKPNQPSDLFALCISRADGKLLWNTKIGTYKTDPRNLYYSSTTRSSVPSLLLAAGTLYLDTHAGSFVQVNPATGEIGWGLNYDSTAPSTDRNYGQPVEQCTVSAPMMVDGVLYFKGMRSRRLCGSIRTSRRCCGAGRSRKTPFSAAWTASTFIWEAKRLPPMTSRRSSYCGPSRCRWPPAGCADHDRRPRLSISREAFTALDKQNGDVVQLFRGTDMDSLGGRLVVTPHAAAGGVESRDNRLSASESRRIRQVKR